MNLACNSGGKQFHVIKFFPTFPSHRISVAIPHTRMKKGVFVSAGMNLSDNVE